jgi:hypothetical protein
VSSKVTDLLSRATLGRAGPQQYYAVVDALLDDRGCLTAAGFAALAAARPGAAPLELAGHLASCPRCQRRLLAGPDSGFQPLGAERKHAPPRWRILIVLAACVILAFIAASLTHWINTPRP